MLYSVLVHHTYAPFLDCILFTWRFPFVTHNLPKFIRFSGRHTMRSPHPLLFHLPPLIPPTSFKLPHSHILTHTTDIRSHILKNNLSPPVVISDHRNKAISAYLQSYPARAQVYIAPVHPHPLFPKKRH